MTAEDNGMSVSADEKVFVLSDEIVDHIKSFFLPTDNSHDKTNQACTALRVLINVIDILMCEIECHDCWELTIKAVESTFSQMLKDLPAVRAEIEAGQRAQSIHWVSGSRVKETAHAIRRVMGHYSARRLASDDCRI
jgi:hypothetical protein